jgi:SPP1 family phage portal protein
VLKRYYDGDHAILSRARLSGLPNNRLAHALPGYITAIAAGYLVGSPVQYAFNEHPAVFEQLIAALRRCDTQSIDAELAVDAAVYGKAVELCYADDQAKPRVAQADPRHAFVVYDDTVEHKPLLARQGAPAADRAAACRPPKADFGQSLSWQAPSFVGGFFVNEE